MSSPHAVITDNNTDEVLDYSAEGAQAWYQTVVNIQAALAEDHGKEVTEEQVEEYLSDVVGIEAPDSVFYELDDQDQYESYLIDLASVDVDDVHFYWFGPRLNTTAPDDDAHYSSEDDEEPTGRKDFDFTVAVAQAVNKSLLGYLDRIPRRTAFDKEVASLISEIEGYRREHGDRAKFPTRFHPMALAEPADWPALAQAIRRMNQKISADLAEARTAARKKTADEKTAARDSTEPSKKKKARTTTTLPKPQKPTVYEFGFTMWPGATCTSIPFRGKQLKDAYGKPGRSWMAIALALDSLAQEIGGTVTVSADREAMSRAGNRALATAILFILAGRGKEVRSVLAAAGFDNFDGFEATVLEFLALTMGVETIRLPFCQLDTVLHLANIVAGQGFGIEQKSYTFLNVFTSVREFITGPQHVFIEGRYTEDKKEITTYQGFTQAAMESDLGRSLSEESKKSAKSAGKSLYSHSAGHPKVARMLTNDREVIEALWTQVRPVGPHENRRRLHAARLVWMGPIRVYNLVANLLAQYGFGIEGMRPGQVAAHLTDAYRCFLTGGQPAVDNVFRLHLPTLTGASYACALMTILQEEKIRPLDRGVLDAVVTALTKPAYDTLDQLCGHPQQLLAVATHLVRVGYGGNQPALHLAVRSGRPWFVQALLDAGADLAAEDRSGATPLALAMELKDAKIIGLLQETQKARRDRLPTVLPAMWATFAKLAKLGDEWLTDKEVATLITGAGLPPDVQLVPAVDVANNPDLLATVIRDDFLAQVVGAGVKKYTVVPINFHSAHWATLVIVQNPGRRSRPTVYFFDSLGQDPAKRILVELLLELTGVYVHAEVHDLSQHLQDDGSTCGTWLALSASTIVNGVKAGQGKDQIKAALDALAKGVPAQHQKNLTQLRT